MLAKLKNAFSKTKEKAMASAVATPLALGVVGITSEGGVVQFEQADKDAIGQGFTNALANLWSGFTAILPYLGMALGVILVIGVAYKIIFKR